MKKGLPTPVKVILAFFGLAILLCTIHYATTPDKPSEIQNKYLELKSEYFDSEVDGFSEIQYNRREYDKLNDFQVKIELRKNGNKLNYKGKMTYMDDHWEIIDEKIEFNDRIVK